MRICHIGSTAIPGMSAKPIIDIMIKVHHINCVDRYNEAMAALGYQAMEENCIPQRRFFQKGGDERTHHVHVFPTGSEHIARHIAFKEYMIAHPEEAKAYSRLKEELAKQFPADMESYIKGKDAFVKEKEKKAIAWYKQKSSTSALCSPPGMKTAAPKARIFTETIKEMFIVGWIDVE